MSEIKNVFDISGRAMASQLVRLNTVASNLANAGTISGSKEEAYRSLKPVFATQFSNAIERNGVSTVDVVGIEAITRDPERVFMPNHPSADGDGYVYRAAVDENEEMIEMVEASRQYQNNVEVISTLRGLMMRTINMGK
ncbi:flagellar basal body rod protein FlgC [Alphaproteobacteria bacterium]|nr:flagellar basal body rod protein FlgC [Alphaproteobacteria bacterium]MDA9010092.1 flagellar basal body rod protein FlgC [bacterium]MDA8797920.1 flagellar basal body rod protein FlgC [Alphaproteobacteria bacterium]MDA9874173.1 flagellar basal body rod protein FlgC [Alphaproteobacteria bacterium]MDA9959317.1 flagellar basal body rod protein FlgC [Alphaproteobacteria bacterium]